MSINNQNKPKLIILTGPTAVGKTALSIKLAKAVNGEIISADSIQVYKHLNIGSAKITEQEMQGVRHHLIDILEPDEMFNVSEFKNLANAAIEDIYSRGKIPIIAGGTGFYIQAVLKDVDFTENKDNGYRAYLEKLATLKGNDYLYEILLETDPESTKTIHKNNVKRVIRALEFFHQTGIKISEHNSIEKERKSKYNFAYFVLMCNRQLLYDRIEKRIDIMINDGLIDEVRSILELYHVTKDMTSMQGLGYKEILQYLNGEITLEEAIYILKRDTRHFAKRQITWFNRETDVIHVDKDILTTEEKQLDYMLSVLKEKRIL